MKQVAQLKLALTAWGQKAFAPIGFFAQIKPLVSAVVLMSAVLMSSCQNKVKEASSDESTAQTPYFNWEGATIYFMLTDRFNNGDLTNDLNYDRSEPTAVLRGFEGGDLSGIIQKIEEMGGMTVAVINGFPKSEIEISATIVLYKNDLKTLQKKTVYLL